MRLRNGADEEQAIITVIWACLRDLKEDEGPEGLKIALRVAKGAKPKGRILEAYGLTIRGKMSQSASNIIQSAVTPQGDLISPFK